ncbi:hypothetical protein ACF0H5_008629 [Mactra antiquata]
MQNVTVTQAYRIGRKQTNQRHGNRSILASFSNPYFTDIVMENAVQLKGKNIGISRDYPREIMEARKELWQDFKDAKQINCKSRVRL